MVVLRSMNERQFKTNLNFNQSTTCELEHQFFMRLNSPSPINKQTHSRTHGSQKEKLLTERINFGEKMNVMETR